MIDSDKPEVRDLSATLPPQHYSIPFSYMRYQGLPVNIKNREGSQTTAKVSYGGTAVDFIGPAHAIKDLFSLPFKEEDSSISVVVHNLGGGTLLVDSDEDDFRCASYPESCFQKILRTPDEKDEAAVPSSITSDSLDQPPYTMSLLENVSRTSNLQGRQPKVLTNFDSETQKQVYMDLTKRPFPKFSREGNEQSNIDTVVSLFPSSRSITAEPVGTIGEGTFDPFLLDLPPPESFTDHAVSYPSPAKEFTPWRFSNYNFVVGSNTIILPPLLNPSSSQSHSHTKSEDFNSRALTVWVADAADLRSKLEMHESVVRSPRNISRNEVYNKHLCFQSARTYSSYAEAASQSLKPKLNENVGLLRDVETASGERKLNGDIPNDENNIDDDLDLKLQSCVMPSSTVDSQLRRLEYELKLNKNSEESSDFVPPVARDLNSSSSAVCTVLDAYLDNVIANVPQLALCLLDKGFVQSIRLFNTEDIPRLSTAHLKDDCLFSNASADSNTEPLFSTSVVETNAAMLLNFLKTHCSQDHSTYLLRRQAGETNIHLFDISALSRQRKRQWIWWLAMMSYRFALRIDQLAKSVTPKDDYVTLRNLRARQRSLLRNALDLLEEHTDMEGIRHETISAAIYEHLAETYLGAINDTLNKETSPTASISDLRSDVKSTDSGLQQLNRKDFNFSCALDSSLISQSLPYNSIKTDSLQKAQDYLTHGIQILMPLIKRSHNPESHNSDNKFNNDVNIQIDAVCMQSFGLHHKLINVLLRLAEHHLRNYWSSSAMQTLRITGRKISNALSLLKHLDSVRRDESDEKKLNSFLMSLFFQYAWLFEYCGQFARSYAADDQWRERGHACGDDIVTLLQDVELESHEVDRALLAFGKMHDLQCCSVFHAMYPFVSLQSLSGIVPISPGIEGSDINQVLSKESVESASALLDKQKQLKRDERRVLVASAVCFVRAIYIIEMTENIEIKKLSPQHGSKICTRSLLPSILLLLRQRYGDACNEIGKILLSEVKKILMSSPAIATFDKEAISPAAPLLMSSEYWFLEALRHFEWCKDHRNIALIRCNLCQCSKIRANTNVALPRNKSGLSPKISFFEDSHAELCLQDAAEHLQLAHTALDERDKIDSRTWDMVSEELAATFLILGVKRRQSLIGAGFTPIVIQSLRLQPGQERSIVQPMEQAITIYQQLGNEYQVAAAHYQLAIFYSKVWTCQSNEGKTRDKLERAFRNFQLAHSYFFSHLEGNESTFVIICLDLSNLYSAVSSEYHCITKALLCCVDTCDAFSPESIERSRERARALQSGKRQSSQPDEDWEMKMNILAKNMDEKVFNLLINLVKIEKENKVVNATSHFRDLYRQLLSQKVTSKDDTDVLGSIHGLLVRLRESLSTLPVV